VIMSTVQPGYAMVVSTPRHTVICFSGDGLTIE
jgi:hypothetical protein